MGQGRLERAGELRKRADTLVAAAGWLSARELYQDALEAYREEDDALGQAACLRGLGDVARQLKELDAAAQHYERALAEARRAQDVAAQAEVVQRLGDLARVSEAWPVARKHLEEAARLYAAAGHRLGEAQCYGLLGEVTRQSGADPEAASDCYRKARDIQLEAGDLKAAAVTLTFMANHLKELGQSRAAAAVFAQAAQIYEGLGLHHRARPFRAAAERLDPDIQLPESNPPRSPWDED